MCTAAAERMLARAVEELEAVVAGRDIEQHIDGDRPAGGCCGVQDGTIQQVVRTGVTVAAVVLRDTIGTQVDRRGHRGRR